MKCECLDCEVAREILKEHQKEMDKQKGGGVDEFS